MSQRSQIAPDDLRGGTRQGRATRPDEPKDAPAIRVTSTVCGLVLGGYAGAVIGFFLVMLLSLPIAMTHGAAQSAWADPVLLLIFLLGGGAGLAVTAGTTVGARSVGDRLARRYGKTRARLIGLTLIALVVLNLAPWFVSAL